MVGDAQDRLSISQSGRHLDLGGGAAVEDGVLDQVGHRLLQKGGVARNKATGLRRHRQGPAALFDNRAIDFADRRRDGGEIQIGDAQDVAAAFDARQGQQGLEQGADLVGFLQRAFDGVVTGLDVLDVGGDLLQLIANPVQRGAQFMSDALRQGFEGGHRGLLPVQHSVQIGRQFVKLAPQPLGGQASRGLAGDDASDRLIDPFKSPQEQPSRKPPSGQG